MADYVEVGPRFNVALYLVAFVTAVAFIAIVVTIFTLPNPTDAQKSAEEWVRATAETGIGLFVGLVKGKGA